MRTATALDDISKNTRAGSENMVAIMKSAVSNTNAGFEQLNKPKKKAVQTMETDMESAIEQFKQVAENALAQPKT